VFLAGGHVVPDAPADHHVGAGLLGHRRHVAAGVPVERVVAVQEHDVPAAGLTDAGVAGGPAVPRVRREPDVTDHVGVLGDEPFHHAGGGIGAVVVHDDHFAAAQ
jgi:hypothetical protein